FHRRETERRGHCFSDLEGGKQAVGGAQQRPTSANDGGHNDAVDFFYKSRGLQPLFTQIELSLLTSNLLDHDITSKSNPMAVVYAKKIDGKLEELGRTETLKLKDQEFLGEPTCVLSEIVTKQTRSLTLKLHIKNGHMGLRNFGALTIHAEETVASRSCVEMIVHCSHLDNKDLFSRSDNPLIIECFDFNSSGNHKLVADLEKLHKERSGANLTLPSSPCGHDKLFVDQFCEKQQYSFLDYISSGSELNFMVAVDFTASNGNPRNPNSLHYIDPFGRLNSYQRAILEVGEVIQFYNSDRCFPAWGFGGRTCDGTTSHCFNLNGSAGAFAFIFGTNYLISFIYQSVEGIEGIMAAYSSALHNVALAGPTLFGKVINKATQIAGQSISYNSNKYFVFLIITDGVLTDLQETKDALVRASDLPLSILIVGVGGADFTQMEVLDADDGRRLESSTGHVATHDIVQFVPMQEVHSKYPMTLVCLNKAFVITSENIHELWITHVNSHLPRKGPYISPPLIHARLSGRIKESKRHPLPEKLNGWILEWP
ncbi:hypothetical protein SO802_005002, partial [Lithocarpus litseifolius]